MPKREYVVEVTAMVRYRHDVVARTPREAVAKLWRRLKRNPDEVTEGVVPAEYAASVAPDEFEVYVVEDGRLVLVLDRLTLMAELLGWKADPAGGARGAR